MKRAVLRLSCLVWVGLSCVGSFGCGDDASPADDAPEDGGREGGPDDRRDAEPDPELEIIDIDLAPEANGIVDIELDEPITNVLHVEDLALALHDEGDVSILDMSDPMDPEVTSRLMTAGRAVAASLDTERRVLFVLTVSGDLRAYGVLDPTAPRMLAQSTITEPDEDGDTLQGMARIADRLYLLGASRVIPVQVLIGQTGSIGFLSESALEIDGEPEAIAAGGQRFLVRLAGGTVQVWSAGDSPSRIDSVDFGAPLRGWVVRGSRVFAAIDGVGLRVVDLSRRGEPVTLFEDTGLDDTVALERFGNLVLVALTRGKLVALDLSDFEAPRAVAARTGSLPDWIAPLGGNLVLGSARELSVFGVPPFVNASVPKSVRGAFPRYGRIPLTLSKPIDVASVSQNTVTLECGADEIDGDVVVSPDGLRVTFLPSEPLPGGQSCTLALDGVSDDLNNALTAAEGALAFRTMAAAPEPIESPKSSYPHTADGTLTDWEPGMTEDYEYSDVTPAVGMYSRFYADHDGDRLWMLNDWFYNGEDIDPDCYNQFAVWTGGGSEQWQIRAYGDQRIEVWLNNSKLDEDDERVTGGYGHGPSPNDESPHTQYEISIQVSPGSWGVQLHDPGPSFGCEQLETDPTTYDAVSTESTSTIDPTLAPRPPARPNPSVTQEESGGLTLRWASQQAAMDFSKYLLEVSRGEDLGAVFFRTWIYGSELRLPPGLLPDGGTYTFRITAFNLAGRTESSPVTFTIGGEEDPQPVAAPTLTSLDPDQLEVAVASGITINGQGFVDGAVAYLDESALNTTYVSATQLMAMVPRDLIQSTGQYSITVRNDADDEDSTSNALTLSVGEGGVDIVCNACLPSLFEEDACDTCIAAVCASDDACCGDWTGACAAVAGLTAECGCDAPNLVSISPASVTAGAQTPFTVTLSNAPAEEVYMVTFQPYTDSGQDDAGGPTPGTPITVECTTDEDNTCTANATLTAAYYDVTLSIGPQSLRYDASTRLYNVITATASQVRQVTLTDITPSIGLTVMLPQFVTISFTGGQAGDTYQINLRDSANNEYAQGACTVDVAGTCEGYISIEQVDTYDVFLTVTPSSGSPFGSSLLNNAFQIQ